MNKLSKIRRIAKIDHIRSRCSSTYKRLKSSPIFGATSSRKATRNAINVDRSTENTETKDEIVSMYLSQPRRSCDSLKIAKYLVWAYLTIISALLAYKSAYIRPRAVLILFLAWQSNLDRTLARKWKKEKEESSEKQGGERRRGKGEKGWYSCQNKPSVSSVFG